MTKPRASTATDGASSERSASETTALLVELGRAVKARSFYAEGEPEVRLLFARAWRSFQGDLRRHGALEVEAAPAWLRVPELTLRVPNVQLGGLAQRLSERGVRTLRFEPTLDQEALALLVELLAGDPEQESSLADALGARATAGLLVNPEKKERADSAPSASPPWARASAAPMESAASAAPAVASAAAAMAPATTPAAAPTPFASLPPTAPPAASAGPAAPPLAPAAAPAPAPFAPAAAPAPAPSAPAASLFDEVMPAYAPSGMREGAPMLFDPNAVTAPPRRAQPMAAPAPVERDENLFDTAVPDLRPDLAASEAEVEAETQDTAPLDMETGEGDWSLELETAGQTAAASARARAPALSAAEVEADETPATDIYGADTPIDIADTASRSPEDTDTEAVEPERTLHPGDEGLGADGRAAELESLMHELAESDDDFQYHDLARRAELLAAALGDEGHGDLAYRALVLFARHAGDDGKRTPLQRDAAMDHLQRLATGGRLAELVDRACAADTEPSLEATQVLLRLGAAVVPMLFRAAEREAEPNRRGQIHGILIAMGEAALPELLRAFESHEPGPVRAAARLAGELQNPRAVAPLLPLLEGPDPSLRQEAAKALVRIGDTRALDALVRALESQVAGVPNLAAFCLGAAASPRAVDALLNALRRAVGRRRYDFATELVRALGRLGRTEAAGDLVALLAHKGSALPRAVARAEARRRRRARPRAGRRGRRGPRAGRALARSAAAARGAERARSQGRRAALSDARASRRCAAMPTLPPTMRVLASTTGNAGSASRCPTRRGSSRSRPARSSGRGARAISPRSGRSPRSAASSASWSACRSTWTAAPGRRRARPRRSRTRSARRPDCRSTCSTSAGPRARPSARCASRVSSASAGRSAARSWTRWRPHCSSRPTWRSDDPHASCSCWCSRAVMAAGLALAVVQRALEPAAASAAEPVLFDVPEGASLRRVARDLEAAGLVRERWAFEGLGRWKRAENALRHGQYALSPAIRPKRSSRRCARGA